MADTTASSNTAIPFSKNDHIIAVLDVTGAGKSTFISKDTDERKWALLRTDKDRHSTNINDSENHQGRLSDFD